MTPLKGLTTLSLLFILVTNVNCAHVHDAVTNSTCPCSVASLCESVTGQPSKELFVFTYNGGQNWKKYDWTKITTLAVFGDYDPAVICHAHKLGARVVYKGFLPAANLSSATDRSRWVREQVVLTKSRHMDGINFDIEYALKEEDAHYLVSLVNETTNAFREVNPHWQVTFDTYPFPGCPAGRCYDYKDLAAACDFVVIMEYNMGGAGPIAKSNDPLPLVKQAVDEFIGIGIPSDKIVLAVPWYGYDWTCIAGLQGNSCLVLDAMQDNVDLPSRTVGDTSFMKDIYYSEITKLLKNSTTGRLYNRTLESPYFNYKDSKTQTYHQVWYDDPPSMSLRYQLAQTKNLRGLAMWNADCLDYTGDPDGAMLTKGMWDAINKHSNTQEIKVVGCGQ